MIGAFEEYEGLSDVLQGSGISDNPVRSDWDLLDLSKKRLKKSVLGSIASQLGVPLEKIVEALGLSQSAFDGQSADELFSVQISEHILKMAELISRGRDLWGDEQAKFKEWLQSEVQALDGKRPSELLDTILGIDMVITIIGRIEHGVHS